MAKTKNKPCPHGRRRDACKECGYVPKKCEHGRRRSQCYLCGGSSICEHGRQRSQCKECGGGATRTKRARKAPVLVVQAELAADGAASSASSRAGKKRAAPEAGAAGPSQRPRGASSGAGNSAAHAKRAHGERRQDRKKRATRRCGRCVKHQGTAANTCKGKGGPRGQRGCEYFEEDGTPKEEAEGAESEEKKGESE